MNRDDYQRAKEELKRAFANAEEWNREVWEIMIQGLWVKWQIDRLDKIADDMERSNGF